MNGLCPTQGPNQDGVRAHCYNLFHQAQEQQRMTQAPAQRHLISAPPAFSPTGAAKGNPPHPHLRRPTRPPRPKEEPAESALERVCCQLKSFHQWLRTCTGCRSVQFSVYRTVSKKIKAAAAGQRSLGTSVRGQGSLSHCAGKRPCRRGIGRGKWPARSARGLHGWTES